MSINSKIIAVALLSTLTAIPSVRAAAKPAGADVGKPVALEMLVRPDGKPLVLKGGDARQQVLVTARFAAGAERDYSRTVTMR